MQLWITFITHTHILSISTRKSTVSQPKILATFLSRIFGVSLFFCPNIITTYAWGILEWGTRLPFPHQTYDEKTKLVFCEELSPLNRNTADDLSFFLEHFAVSNWKAEPWMNPRNIRISFIGCLLSMRECISKK